MSFAVLLLLLAPQYRIAYWLNDALWTMSTEGGFARKIADGLPYERPIVSSPDGRRLIYWDHGAGHWDLISVAPDGSDRRNLTTDLGGGCRSAVFSPDSSRIAFMCDGPNGLYVMKADGNGKTRLSELGHRDEPPAWSSDGKMIAWADLADSGMTVYVISSAGGRPTRVGKGWGAVWTPDGTSVIYSVGGELRRWNRSTARDERLLTGATAARFSPLGDRIAYTNAQGYVVVAKWPSLQAIFTSEKESRSYAWSPDGGAIAYSSANGIRVRSLASSSETVLPIPTNWFAWLRAN